MPVWLSHWIDRIYLRRKRKKCSDGPVTIHDHLRVIQKLHRRSLGDGRASSQEELSRKSVSFSLPERTDFNNPTHIDSLTESSESQQISIQRRSLSCIPWNRTNKKSDHKSRAHSVEVQKCTLNVTPGGEIIMPVQRHISDVCESEKVDEIPEAECILPIELHRTESLISPNDNKPRCPKRRLLSKSSHDSLLNDTKVDRFESCTEPTNASKQRGKVLIRHSSSTQTDVMSNNESPGMANNPTIFVEPPSDMQDACAGECVKTINNQAATRRKKLDRTNAKGRMSSGRRRKKPITKSPKRANSEEPGSRSCDPETCEQNRPASCSFDRPQTCPCSRNRPILVNCTQQTVSHSRIHEATSTETADAVMRRNNGLIQSLIDRVTWEMADSILARANYARSLRSRSNERTTAVLRDLFEFRRSLNSNEMVVRSNRMVDPMDD